MVEEKSLYPEVVVVLEMAIRTTIGSKGRIALTKELMEKYHLQEGEKVVILDAGDDILLKHGCTSPRGTLKGKLDAIRLREDLR